MESLGLVVAVLAAIIAFVTAWWLKGRAGRLGLLQEPNGRSSHTVPTPSGGGVGIVAGGTFAGLLMGFMLPWVGVPVLMAGVLIAFIGYYDDRRPLSVRWRLGAQVLLMGSVAAVLPLDTLSLALGVPFSEPLLMIGVTLAGALWINLYNFMDGIDGLAASEAIFLLLAAPLLAVLAIPGVEQHPLFWWMIGLAAACLGFLLLNWPPAKIFMGDAGSTYLGLMLAFFAFATVSGTWVTTWQWLILMSLFLADSLTTLGRRILRRERFWEAHRSHAYQHLQRRFGSHLKVTLLYLAIDVLVLLPLAWLAGEPAGGWGWAVALAIYAVLVPLALSVGAGVSEPQADDIGARADDGE